MYCTRELFRNWTRCRDGTITRVGMQRLLYPIRQQVEGFLLRGIFTGNAEIVGMWRELYTHREWLWTFLEVAGVEPTNNASERALRHAVIWRKLSFGTQSAHSSRFVATILTVVETCRQQSRNVFEHLTSAMQAHYAHESAPSLLPSARTITPFGRATLGKPPDCVFNAEGIEITTPRVGEALRAYPGVNRAVASSTPSVYKTKSNCWLPIQFGSEFTATIDSVTATDVKVSCSWPIRSLRL